MEVEISSKQSSFGHEVVKALGDISNSVPLTPNAAWAKEKMLLMKQLQDKNKLIELAGMEIENLSGRLQKMQRQNWSLAQRNSLLLSEQSVDKKRFLVLQHELASKKALLKVKEVEYKAKTKAVAKECRHENSKPCKISRMGRPSRSQSLGGPVVSEILAAKEALGRKRRQSTTSSRVIHQEPSEDLFEIDDAEILPLKPLDDSDIKRRQSTTSSRVIQQDPSEDLFEIDDAEILPLKPLDDSATRKEVIKDSSESKVYEEEFRRSSVGRPRRRSAAKIESYKEIPLNTKMRRT